jgi:GNAT superfamily N-acetyltransferase
MKKNIIIKDGMPSSQEWIYLRESVQWSNHSRKDYNIAKENTLFGVTIYFDNKVIAMGRVIGDGVICFYLQDVIVHPKWQKNGIGNIVVEHLLSYIYKNAANNATIALLAAKGTENFYASIGFSTRSQLKKGEAMMIDKFINPNYKEL